jgi:hypothetical protein
MTRVLLCAGPTLLVVSRDGALFFRRPGQPDARIPYSPENYPVFLESARQKYDLTPVVGPHGEEGPAFPDDAPIPELRPEHLPTGETVYRLVEELPEQSRGNRLEGSAAPVKGSVAKGTQVSS